VYASDLGICVDGNACEITPCIANSDCVDKVPPALTDATGRTCTCSAGFTLSGGVCVDINACTNFPCGTPTGTEVAATCRDLPAPAGNNKAGRLCACGVGQSQTATDTCIDINACALVPCDPHAVCKDLPNKPGDDTGRSCVCNTGYKGDGENCVPESFSTTQGSTQSNSGGDGDDDDIVGTSSTASSAASSNSKTTLDNDMVAVAIIVVGVLFVVGIVVVVLMLRRQKTVVVTKRGPTVADTVMLMPPQQQQKGGTRTMSGMMNPLYDEPANGLGRHEDEPYLEVNGDEME